MKFHHCLVVLLTVALAACQSAGAPAPQSAKINQAIQLAPGDKVAFDLQGLNVEFVRVVEDSRCPSDTTCVWAGEVKVQLSTRIGTAEAVRHEIVAGQHAMVGDLRVVVVQVQPERISTQEIAPEQYRVTLKVERVTPI